MQVSRFIMLKAPISICDIARLPTTIWPHTIGIAALLSLMWSHDHSLHSVLLRDKQFCEKKISHTNFARQKRLFFISRVHSLEQQYCPP